MVTKWKIERWSAAPEPVEVVSETAHFVTVKIKSFKIDGPNSFYERRMKKDGTIYDTFDDAKHAMIESAKRKVVSAESIWQRAKAELQAINNMKRPNGARDD